MSVTDDDLDGAVPDADADATPSERIRARSFGELVDKALTGHTPAAMSTDDRALLEAATVIRATAGRLELAAGRERTIVEAALRQAIGGVAPARLAAVAPVVPLRGRRWAPWLMAATSSVVAIAALAMLWLRPVAHRAAPTAAAMPTSWTSRPSDALIGPIASERAGDASARLDYIFADRLDGYRERRLARGGRP